MTAQSPLKQIFCDNKDAKFVFVQPGGNFGDFLIYFGLEVLARKLNLSFRSLSAEEFLSQKITRDEILYLHGSGGFNQWCSEKALKVLEHALYSGAKLVVQGPSTIDQDMDYLENRLAKVLKKPGKPPLYFIAREMTTFALCNDYLAGTGAHFFHDQDTAFWADKDLLESFAGPSISKYRFYALREDNESSGQSIHDYGNGVQLDPAYFCKSFKHWVRVHLYATEIITTRTHSAVVGALLNKPVVLYPGRYHKNRSIWEYSLQHRNVIWGENEDRPYRKTRFNLHYLPARVRNSYRVNQAARWLQRVPLS